MREIVVLDPVTIDKIAAGEVVERPASVAKELMENAIDAAATSITLEIREGGIAFLRVTDNGAGIPADQMEVAFARHATSKIRAVEDLLHIASLGFRGEALSSIAAVSRVECISRTAEEAAGTRLLIEGGTEKEREEIGAPVGTSVIVRDLFYNTPARAKFLKSAVTEGNRVAAVVEGLALSHPEIAFKFVQDGKEKLYTSGNGDLRELAFQIFGRDVARSLLPVEWEQGDIAVAGFVAAPPTSRGNRDFENYFINGRMVKNATIMRAIEDAYHGYLMQHRYPFALLYITMQGESVDVNVHPSKQEVRFSASDAVYRAVQAAVRAALKSGKQIPEIRMNEEAEETERAEKTPLLPPKRPAPARPLPPLQEKNRNLPVWSERVAEEAMAYEQSAFLTPEARAEHRLLGQLFNTYWIVQHGDRLFIIDQHAAHEKVLYERITRRHRTKEVVSQTLQPATVISPSKADAALLSENLERFTALGFEIEPFGGDSFKISAIPADLYSIAGEDFFQRILENLQEIGRGEPDLLLDRLATISCKAAVKGNDRLSPAEAEHLIDELLSLDDPYHCPHGRPTIISMSRSELEKKFGRIV